MPSLSPTSGPAGTLVTIKGVNFGANTDGKIKLSVTNASLKIWEPLRIVVRVPGDVLADGATKTSVVVTVDVPDTETGENFTLQYTCPPFRLTDPAAQKEPAKAGKTRSFGSRVVAWLRRIKGV